MQNVSHFERRHGKSHLFAKTAIAESRPCVWTSSSAKPLSGYFMNQWWIADGRTECNVCPLWSLADILTIPPMSALPLITDFGQGIHVSVCLSDYEYTP